MDVFRRRKWIWAWLFGLTGIPTIFLIYNKLGTGFFLLLFGQIILGGYILSLEKRILKLEKDLGLK